MKKMLCIACILVPVALVACGEDEPTADSMTATITDHADALTVNGGDALFDIAISEAESTYDLSELQVSVTPAGGTAVVVEIALSDDADGDGAAGKGDTLSASEGVDNAFDDSHAGTDLAVAITYQPAEGDPVELFSGTWSAQ